jgi:predicted nucleic-acid-binding protein
MAKLSGSLDANILLRYLVNDVPTQNKLVCDLLLSTKGQYAVAYTAIIEVAFMLERAYSLSREQICEAIEGLAGLDCLNFNRGLFLHLLPLYKINKSLSMEDCALASYAVLNNAEPLYTFDIKLAKKSPHAQLLN